MGFCLAEIGLIWRFRAPRSLRTGVARSRRICRFVPFHLRLVVVPSQAVRDVLRFESPNARFQFRNARKPGARNLFSAGFRTVRDRRHGLAVAAGVLDGFARYRLRNRRRFVYFFDRRRVQTLDAERIGLEVRHHPSLSIGGRKKWHVMATVAVASLTFGHLTTVLYATAAAGVILGIVRRIYVPKIAASLRADRG